MPGQTRHLPLVLFHGLLSSPQEFGLIHFGLRSRGVHLVAPTIPNYTLATDVKRPDWNTWLSAALQALDDAVDADTPVILGGLCVGSMLAAQVARHTTRKVAGLVLMSPAFRYDGWGMSAIRHLRHVGYWTGLDRFFYVAEREPYGVKNPKVRQWIAEQLRERAESAAGPARVPLPALRESERMMADVRAHLDELNCPTLVLHARDDEITTLGSVQRVVDLLPTPDKALISLNDSYHMITIDNDRHEVARQLEGFVKRLSRAEMQKFASEPSLPGHTLAVAV